MRNGAADENRVVQGVRLLRKRYLRKRRSCGLCKPHKLGGVFGAKRWTDRELQALKDAEREIAMAVTVKRLYNEVYEEEAGWSSG